MEANNASPKSAAAKRKQRQPQRIAEKSYEPIVPRKVENRRALDLRRPRYPLEGRGEQLDVLSQWRLSGAPNPITQVKSHGLD